MLVARDSTLKALVLEKSVRGTGQKGIDHN